MAQQSCRIKSRLSFFSPLFILKLVTIRCLSPFRDDKKCWYTKYTVWPGHICWRQLFPLTLDWFHIPEGPIIGVHIVVSCCMLVCCSLVVWHQRCEVICHLNGQWVIVHQSWRLLTINVCVCVCVAVANNNSVCHTLIISLNTGLFKMVVGVLITCHTQYTGDNSICIFFI